MCKYNIAGGNSGFDINAFYVAETSRILSV